MPPFFHGWRRKIGVATLVVACSLASLWMRSMRSPNESERLAFRDWDGYYYWICSHDQEVGVRWHAWQLSGPRMPFYLKSPDHPSYWPKRVEYRFEWPPDMWVIPYWSIVFPLTLLSAYLLLRKQRVAKRNLNQPDDTVSPENTPKNF